MKEKYNNQLTTMAVALFEEIVELIEPFKKCEKEHELMVEYNRLTRAMSDEYCGMKKNLTCKADDLYTILRNYTLFSLFSDSQSGQGGLANIVSDLEKLNEVLS